MNYNANALFDFESVKWTDCSLSINMALFNAHKPESILYCQGNANIFPLHSIMDRLEKVACFMSFMQLIFKMRVINFCHGIQWKMPSNFVQQWFASMTSLKRFNWIINELLQKEKYGKNCKCRYLCDGINPMHAHLKCAEIYFHNIWIVELDFSFFLVAT